MLNALVLCGAVPVYVNPEVDKRIGISLGMKREQVEKAIKEHPNAVAVLVNNPTYYGICSDPVSYTHLIRSKSLEVYCLFMMRKKAKTITMNVTLILAIILICIKAVSYTHLDVYKRQLLCLDASPV